MTEPLSQKALKALDAIVDKVLTYKPKPKTKSAKKRKKRVREDCAERAEIELANTIIHPNSFHPFKMPLTHPHCNLESEKERYPDGK